MTPVYHMGLDLGQLKDYTALTVLKEHYVWRPREASRIHGTHEMEAYHLTHLERFPLGTPYLTVARRVRDIQAAIRHKHDTRTPCNIVVDTTGVGMPVFEMLQAEGCRGLIGITITGGNTVTRDGQLYHVPKRDLVSCLSVLFQNGKLRFARGLPFAEVMRHELQSFKVKINIATGHDAYEAWREADHDDMVLALAIAAWYAEHPRALVGSRLLTT